MRFLPVGICVAAVLFAAGSVLAAGEDAPPPETPTVTATVSLPGDGLSVRRLPATEQIRAEVSDVVAEGGSFKIQDLGDGCAYEEVYRSGSVLVLQDIACEVFYTYDSASSELKAWIQ